MKIRSRTFEFLKTVRARWAAVFALILTAIPNGAYSQQNTEPKPNILVIMGDDIGWFNASCYNSGMMGYRTPNIDRIANEGARFTDWYGQQSCTAGRAAFITGQSPIRTGLTKVGLPGADIGLSDKDPSVAEVLKQLGYATGQFGKNHLGDKDEFLPTKHGFDEFFGNLYHLNAEEEPENPDYPKDPAFKQKYGPRGVPHAFVDGKVEDTGPLTKKRMETVDEEFLAAATDFMDRQTKANKPFFRYFNSTRMHLFTHLKPESDGKTGLGLEADGMVEHDGTVGTLLKKLDDLGIAENTIVVYTSDNGAEVFTWPDGGTTPFKGEKATNWEGGFRVPTVMRWPGVIKPGTVINDLCAHEDFLPTFAAAAGETDAIGYLDLKADGPTVIEAPPHMLGFMEDGLQRYIADIGPLGADKGNGGKFLVLPPDFQGNVPDGYFVSKSPTYSVTFGMRGFQSQGSTDQAVSLMKQTKVYPLDKASAPPAMQFLNGSKHDIDTIFPDNFHFFEFLAMLVDEEPLDSFSPFERFQMQAIGIEKGKPFTPDDNTKALLDEAGRLGGAMARANTYGSVPEGGYYYPGRKWQGFPGGVPWNFLLDGIPQIDVQNNVYYMALGNSPAMVEKNVGQGSQYLWTYRDSDGNFLDGAKNYRLHIPPNIPAGNFWSVLVYDSLSRSELQNGQPFPSLSSYSKPVVNADGSIDIALSPDEPKEKGNWIKTVPGRGFFPMFRFYGPAEAFFDKTWQLEDVVAVK